MSKLTKKERQIRIAGRVMRAAHLVARRLKDRFGDYQIAFTFAIRLAWKVARENNGHVDGTSLLTQASLELVPDSVAGVPAWVINKDLIGFDARRVFFYTESTKVVRETEKAKQITFHIHDTENGEDWHGDITLWVGKSIMVKD
ncbi:hypothetical protein [Lacticaseibacillus absianus]|uniref:hypothetical protein n=1 Tax=Lacticaseibacillus absianus TaxID=2729623 RepID=UPI0015CE8865|nr:hypothetical protein [Lacticaseibacillus absianus]